MSVPQLSHEQGVDVQTSFMFLTIGLVPMLVSTVAFLPKTRVPWPLPANYGKRRNQSLDENLLRKQRAWQRRLSGNEHEDGWMGLAMLCEVLVLPVCRRYTVSSQK